MKPMSAFVCVLTDACISVGLSPGNKFSGLRYVPYSDLVGITQEFSKVVMATFTSHIQDLCLSHIWHCYGFLFP